MMKTVNIHIKNYLKKSKLESAKQHVKINI